MPSSAIGSGVLVTPTTMPAPAWVACIRRYHPTTRSTLGESAPRQTPRHLAQHGLPQ